MSKAISLNNKVILDVMGEDHLPGRLAKKKL